MTPFIVVAALLLTVVLVSLVYPLLSGSRKRSQTSSAALNASIYAEQLAELDADLKAGNIGQAQWEASRTDIQRRGLEEETKSEASQPGKSIGAAATLVVLIPVLAVAMYAWRGNPQALSPQAAADNAAHNISPEQIESMAARLAAKLEQKPDDGQGWIMLGRTYAALGRFPDAAGAFAKGVKLVPEDASLLADYADILAMANGRKLAGEPTKLIERALKVDGNNVKALALAGSAAFDRNDFRAAVGYWKKVEQAAPPDSEFIQSIRSSIAEAEQRLSGSPAAKAPAPSAPASSAEAKAAGTGTSVQGKVSLGAKLAAKIKPEDSVFVFARPADGPHMPLAIIRRHVKDLPFDFSLDDSMAMDPTMKLSSVPKVVIVARVSKSGSAALQKGDFEVASQPVAPGTKGIKLEING